MGWALCILPSLRSHLIRFHRAIAPHAKLRAVVVPSRGNISDHASERAPGAPTRMSWVRLLKRVFGIDIEHCPNCGARLKIIAAIEDPVAIVSILTYLGVPARAPRRSPARRVDLFQPA